LNRNVVAPNPHLDRSKHVFDPLPPKLILIRNDPQTIFGAAPFRTPRFKKVERLVNETDALYEAEHVVTGHARP